jgi:hypothetical protein
MFFSHLTCKRSLAADKAGKRRKAGRAQGHSYNKRSLATDTLLTHSRSR